MTSSFIERFYPDVNRVRCLRTSQREIERWPTIEFWRYSYDSDDGFFRCLSSRSDDSTSRASVEL